jgi:hemerythrin-like domain-containing protein/uncharacterized protein (DUF2249 family)
MQFLWQASKMACPGQADGGEPVTSVKIVEMAGRPWPEGVSEILTAFDRLSANQAIEVAAERETGPLLHLLRQKSQAAFDWWPLEEGPAHWRVMIVKRDDAGARTVTDFLAADHGRLHEVWDDFRQGVSVCDLARIRSRSAEFALGLRRHIRMEEEILFPAIDERTGMQKTGPTAVMRMEHREIERLLDRLSAIAEAENCATVKQAAEAILANATALFESHDFKERKILYPMADRVLETEEVSQLVLKMQAL